MICWFIIIWEAKAQSSLRNSCRISLRSEESYSPMMKDCTSAAVSPRSRRNSSTKNSSKQPPSSSAPSTKPTATCRRFIYFNADQDLQSVNSSQFLLQLIPHTPRTQQTPHHHHLHGKGHQRRTGTGDLQRSLGCIRKTQFESRGYQEALQLISMLLLSNHLPLEGGINDGWACIRNLRSLAGVFQLGQPRPAFVILLVYLHEVAHGESGGLQQIARFEHKGEVSVRYLVWFLLAVDEFLIGISIRSMRGHS